MTGREHGTPARYQRGPDEHGTEGKGCRCRPCTAANSAYCAYRDRMIAYGRWEGMSDAAGTRRRLQALMWNGWSEAAIAARRGCTRRAVHKLLCYGRVSAATAAGVRALYDALWDVPPPEGTPRERRAATIARRHARERGWAGPWAWDDGGGPHCIDDPAGVPVPGWQRRDGVRGYGFLLDEVDELIGLGEDPRFAAERLGVSQRTVERALARRKAGMVRGAGAGSAGRERAA